MDERCLSCGRDTRAGTPLFSARKRGIDTSDGREGYLCHACQVGSAGLGSQSTVPLSGRFAVMDVQGGIHGH